MFDHDTFPDDDATELPPASHTYGRRGRRRRRLELRHPCPTCKRPDAISEAEKRKGYHCAGCTRAAEFGA